MGATPQLTPSQNLAAIPATTRQQPTKAKGFGHVLLCTALSPYDQNMLLLAREFGHAGAISQLTLLHACAYPEPFSADPAPHDHAQRLAQLADDLRRQGINVTTSLVYGEASSVILRTVRRQKTDLILLGRQKPRHLERLAPSITDTVLRSCSCPVLNLGPLVEATFLHQLTGPVVFATDFHDPAEEAIHLAARYASQRGVRLHCIHVIPPGRDKSESAAVASIMSNALTQRALNACDRHEDFIVGVLNGVDACYSITQYALLQNAQAIVMATQNINGLARFFAPDRVHRIIATARCPVLTLCPTGGLPL